jgi:hypothetical protein
MACRNLLHLAVFVILQAAGIVVAAIKIKAVVPLPALYSIPRSIISAPLLLE